MTDTKTTEKPGLIKKWLNKLDESMKEKAEKASDSNCCGPNSKGGKGGSCC